MVKQVSELLAHAAALREELAQSQESSGKEIDRLCLAATEAKKQSEMLGKQAPPFPVFFWV